MKPQRLLHAKLYTNLVGMLLQLCQALYKASSAGSINIFFENSPATAQIALSVVSQQRYGITSISWSIKDW